MVIPLLANQNLTPILFVIQATKALAYSLETQMVKHNQEVKESAMFILLLLSFDRWKWVNKDESSHAVGYRVSCWSK